MPAAQPNPDSPPFAPPEDAFRFGRNWQRYVERHLTPEREDVAAESVRELLGIDLAGCSFLDVGAGSGLFSLAAYRLGARSVVSFDVDPESVASCRYLREREGEPDHWNVMQGSILDTEFVGSLDPADVVYSWGVLHHTGDMDQAIRNAASLVRPGGVFVIAIYNRVTVGLLKSEGWVRVKRAYTRAPRPVQRVLDGLYLGQWGLGRLARGINPVRHAREYKRNRGMAMSTDVSDWLGGYPYEFATAPEILALCEGELGLRALKVLDVPPSGIGNNQFVFERPGPDPVARGVAQAPVSTRS